MTCSIPKCPSVEQNSSQFLQVLLTPDQDLTASQMKVMSGSLGFYNRDLHPKPLQYLEVALREDI